MNIIIGKSGSRNVTVDLDTLLRTRALLQANSGGGKSFLIRRIVEQLVGKVQTIIVDVEGEFATLREKYPFILVGEGGETPADLRSAGMLAEKLLELRASAVCDLFEAFRKNPQGRHAWVKIFCNALLDAPKKFWHPVVLVIDEFHKFVPEKGAGESEASEAVIGIGTAGRKRGICLIGATQRLAKVRKDVTAELLNRFVGPTFEDVDVKRAADLLSVLKEDQTEFFAEMRTLEPGHFYCFGRAVSKVRILCKVGPVQTTHPEMGSSKHAAEPPPAPEAIAKLLPKLSDLPKAAEEKAKTEADLRKELRDLKIKLRTQPTVATEVKVADPKAIERALDKQRKEYERIIKLGNDVFREGVRAFSQIRDIASKAVSIHGTPLTLPKVSVGEIPKKEIPRVDAPRLMAPRPVTLSTATPRPDSTSNGDITGPEKKILMALSQLRAIGKERPTRPETAGWAGYSPNGSAFKNPVGHLNVMGLVTYPSNGNLELTEQGLAIIGEQPPPDADELRQRILAICDGPEQKILAAMLAHGKEAISREALAEATQYSPNGSAFKNPIGGLKSKGFIEYPTAGKVKPADWLFVEE